MSYLVIDIGNSKIKGGIWNSLSLEDTEPDTLFETDRLDETLLKKWIATRQSMTTLICSVRRLEDNFLNWCAAHGVQILHHEMEVGFPVLYESKSTLGMDRLAAVAGAIGLAGGGVPAMVIDAGSCITYEYINERSEYVGGAISPGLRMRYRAMHQFTGKLPAVEPSEELPEFYGRDTITSMRAGTEIGFISEINVFVEAFKNKYPHSVIFLCGGDSIFIQKNSSYKMHYRKHLVLLGLLKILQANA